VYLTGDGLEVYEESFMKIAKPDGTNFVPTLILVGTRLGLDTITPVYWEALKSSLQMPQSIGIAG
jgi:cysteine protease ATG4